MYKIEKNPVFKIIKEEIAGENEVKELGLNEAQINDLVVDIFDRLKENKLIKY